MHVTERWIRHGPAAGAAARSLLAAGFCHGFSRAYFARSLADELPVAAGNLTLEPVTRAVFDELLGRSLVGSPHRRPGELSLAGFLDDLAETFGAALDPTLWRGLSSDGRLVGVAMPQWIPNEPGAATLAFLGVIPGERGRGLGRAAHRHVLGQLRETGAVLYRDTVDVLNAPMLRIMRDNQCVLERITHHFLLSEAFEGSDTRL